MTNISTHWDAHWENLATGHSAFSLAALVTRRYIFQPALAHYTRRFFAPTGIFAEMGCGTAESSAGINREGRTLVGVDFSAPALVLARKTGCLTALVQGDIFSTPCRDASLDGIWNLGVMEHFTEPELHRCLGEFRRVLKPGGSMILFWPTQHNSSRWILGPIESLRTWFGGQAFAFYPGDVTRIRSRKALRSLLESHGFEILRMDFSVRTALIHMVIVSVKRK